MNEDIEHILESERCLLGIIMNYNEYLVQAMELINEDDFYRTSHKIIFSTMLKVYKKNMNFDLVILINHLKEEIKDSIVTVSEITLISSSCITQYTFEGHLKIVLDGSRKRKLDNMCQRVINSEDSFDKKIEDIQNELLKINSHNVKDKYFSMNEVMESTLKRIEIASNSKDGITGIPTGVSILDDAINGLERGSMVVFGARPSMGKTAFSLKILEHIQAKLLYVQLDMTLEGMGQRILATDTGISNNRIGKGRLNNLHFEKIVKSISRMEKKDNLFFYSPGIATISKIMFKAKEIKLRHGLDVIIIDHIGKITPETKGTKYEKMTEISNRIKSIARELDVCIIVLCQLSRTVEQRTDKHPILSDLRDTGAIEEDADVIGFLYREGYYKDKSLKSDTLEVSFEKNRNGQTGKIEFEYNLVTQELIEVLEE